MIDPLLKSYLVLIPSAVISHFIKKKKLSPPGDQAPWKNWGKEETWTTIVVNRCQIQRVVMHPE